LKGTSKTYRDFFFFNKTLDDLMKDKLRYTYFLFFIERLDSLMKDWLEENF